LLSGGKALHVEGDLHASRAWFDAAFRAARLEDDAAAMGLAALGFSGLWVHEQRTVTASAQVDDRLREALGKVDQHSSIALRLRSRLAAESDYREGRYEAILAAVGQARAADHPIALAEALSLAHHCVLGPGLGHLRNELAQELLTESFRTSRPSDQLMGMLWRVVDLFLEGDRHAERRLAELNGLLTTENNLAVAYVAKAIEVMLSIRGGRLEEAEKAAGTCVEMGLAAGDIDASGWYSGQLLAIRWYQGRVSDLLPTLQEMVNSPTLSMVDDSCLAALAVAAATAGDVGQATAALARLRGGDLSTLPRSSSWLVTFGGIVEAAFILQDKELLSEAYELLLPFANLPMMGSLAVTCFGSVQHALGLAALGIGQVERSVEHFRAAVRDNQSIGHLPAAARSRAQLATALTLRGGHAANAEAERELSLATADAAELGVVVPAIDPSQAGSTDAGRQPDRLVPLVFQRRGRMWQIEFGRQVALVEHCLGMGYLAALTANPGYEIPSIELAAGEWPASSVPVEGRASSGQAVLDPQAKRAYREKISTLKAEIDEHTENHDLVRAERAKAECDWLIAELAAATGLGGRVRNFTGTEERARVAVGKAVRRAVSRIAAVDPVIGEVLCSTVQTGLRCSYKPY